MELGEQTCPACGGDGWHDWPVTPCRRCEGSGFAGIVRYLRPADRPRMFTRPWHRLLKV